VGVKRSNRLQKKGSKKRVNPGTDQKVPPRESRPKKGWEKSRKTNPPPGPREQKLPQQIGEVGNPMNMRAPKRETLKT